MTFWKWSRVAASNANADSTVNWAEGMSPSAVNDSGRAMMAAAAKYRDDISGATATGGTASAYTLSTFQAFASLANLDGKIIAFTPHATNGDGPTLNVDSLGAKDIRGVSGEALGAGVLIEGTPYQALYNSANNQFVLLGFFGNPYNVPIASGMDWWGTTVPNSSFVFPYGQAISRTTYATCFARMGTAYGVGDGTTTFNLPDKRGRVVAGKDDMGGTSANRLTNQTGGLNGDTLGATGGAETHSLTEAQLAAHTHGPGTYLAADHTHGVVAVFSINPNTVQAPGGQPAPNAPAAGNTGNSGALAVSGTSGSTGSGAAHNNVQPSIVANYIVRVI